MINLYSIWRLVARLVRSSLSHTCLEPSGNYRCSTPSKRRIRYGSGLHLVHRTAKAGYIILGSSDVTRNTRGCATRTKPSSVTLTFSSVIAVRALRLLIDAAGERDTHSILTSTAVTRARRVYGPLSASGREKNPWKNGDRLLSSRLELKKSCTPGRYIIRDSSSTKIGARCVKLYANVAVEVSKLQRIYIYTRIGISILR